jgi:hypothetical protein
MAEPAPPGESDPLRFDRKSRFDELLPPSLRDTLLASLASALDARIALDDPQGGSLRSNEGGPAAAGLTTSAEVLRVFGPRNPVAVACPGGRSLLAEGYRFCPRCGQPLHRAIAPRWPRAGGCAPIAAGTRPRPADTPLRWRVPR